MKTIRITLVKEGAQATITHLFRTHDFPDQTTWQGNREAFTAPDGRVPAFTAGIYNLERVVTHQANLCGATFTIEDLGGEAIFAHDIIRKSKDEGTA